MKLFVTFKQQNPDFNKKYANEYHSGKESDGNWKDNWSIGFELPDKVEKIAIIEKGDLKVLGKNEDGVEINASIPNMTILECFVNNEVVDKFAVSKDLIKKTHKAYNGKYDTTRFYFYFKPREDYFKISDWLYVLEEDIPQILKKN